MIGETNSINIIGEEWAEYIYNFTFINSSSYPSVLPINIPHYVSDLSETFSGITNSNCENFIINKLTQNSIPIKNLYRAFRNSHIDRITLNINTKQVTNFTEAFYGCTCRVIDGEPLDFSGINSTSNSSNIFANCSNLEEVRFVPQSVKYQVNLKHSSELSSDTIDSLIAGLNPSYRNTLSFYSKDTLTEAQKQQIIAKGWNISYYIN